MMKKIHFLLLISLLLAACSDDDKEKQPAFVTNITISDAGKTFNPGDAVTVKADGLQSGDQIILNAGDLRTRGYEIPLGWQDSFSLSARFR